METQPLLIKKGWLRALFFFFSFFIIVALFDLIGILIVSQFSEYGFEGSVILTFFLCISIFLMDKKFQNGS